MTASLPLIARNGLPSVTIPAMTALIKRKSIEAVASRRPARETHASQDADRPVRKPRYAPVTFSEQGGVRYLHFGTEWVQGAMRLRKPDWIELEYAQQMMAWLLFLEPEGATDFHIAQLGLGAASLTKFCHRAFPDARVTAVELNPSVVVAARSMFGLPPDDGRLSVLEMDAFDFVASPANAGTLDVLQVDLYDATARGPVLDTLGFYRTCRKLLKAPGVLTINLFGDHSSFPRNIERICEAFDDRVLVFPEVHDGNVIALAFNGPPLAVEWEAMDARARAIQKSTGIPSSGWPEGLRRANARQEDMLQI